MLRFGTVTTFYSLFTTVRLKVLANIHNAYPGAPIPGNRQEMKNQVSSRHQTNLTSGPHQYWLSREPIQI